MFLLLLFLLSSFARKRNSLLLLIYLKNSFMRPCRHIYHDIGIPRPKNHDIEIPGPKNRDIEIRGLKHHDIEKRRQLSHDIVIARHFFRGQKATTSRFRD